MPKKQTTEIAEMTIDYCKIIDGMSDETFAFCVNYLYPVFDYKVLQQNEIRKVDIKEQLVGIQTIFSADEKLHKHGLLHYYLDIIKKYFNNTLKCEKDSRAEKSRLRGCELIENALSDSITDYDVEDCVLIFLALFREIRNELNVKDRKLISDITLQFSKDEADLLKEIIASRLQTPVEDMKIPVIDKLWNMSNDADLSTKIMYVNSILFLCKGLQDRGVFLGED